MRQCFPQKGKTRYHHDMTNADAVRAVLHDLLVEQYGGIEAAAPQVGIPHKSLHRAFTKTAKDRTKTVSLNTVMQVIAALERDNPKITVRSVFQAADKLEQSGI